MLPTGFLPRRWGSDPGGGVKHLPEGLYALERA